jgi:hypothetical protein
MVLKVDLPPTTEQWLVPAAAQEGISAEDYILRLIRQHLPAEERRKLLAELLQCWIDEVGEGESAEESDEYLRALDAARLSDRPLYPPELKGITW